VPLSWYRDWARRYREFPSYPNGVMGLGIREEARRRGSRVLLGGVGGDEWLCGSHSYYAEALTAKQWRTFVDCLDADRRAAGLLRSLGWAGRHGFYPLLPENFRTLVRKVLIGHRRDEGIDRLAWLAPSMKALAQQRRGEHSAPAAVRSGTIAQLGQRHTLTDAYATLARELEERMAASVGIELRRPFFDVRMVQFAFATSPRLRLRGNTDKFLHRKAMKGLLPESVLSREQKAEFSVTFRWYMPEMKEMVAGHDGNPGVNWVDRDRAMHLHHRTDADQQAGLPHWLLWTLFGCRTLISGPGGPAANGSPIDAILTQVSIR